MPNEVFFTLFKSQQGLFDAQHGIISSFQIPMRVILCQEVYYLVGHVFKPFQVPMRVIGFLRGYQQLT